MRRVVSGTGPRFGAASKINWEKTYLRAILAAAEEEPLLVDVAPAYADGQAERLLGSNTSINERVRYMTKLRIHRDGGPQAHEVFSSSLASLKRPHVDYLCTHWSGSVDEFRHDLEFLLEAKFKGLAQDIGIGNPTLGDIEIARAEGVLPYLSFVQAEFSLSDSSIKDVLSAAGLQHLTIFGYSPLSEGRLAPNSEARQVIKEISNLEQITESEVVLAYLMRTPTMRPITISRLPDRHFRNVGSDKLHLTPATWVRLERIEDSLTIDLPLGWIEVTRALAGEHAYTSLHEAQKNDLGLSPSPLELSKEFIDGASPLKLLKVRRSQEADDKFLLIQGQLRYWALMLAFGADHYVRAVITD